MKTFTVEQLAEHIDALMAFDAGCTDSGIRDDTLKAEIKEYLKYLTKGERDTALWSVCQLLYFQGSPRTLGDVQEFITWLAIEMNLHY